jgi:hypothetical protein
MSEPTTVECPSCGKKLKVRPELAGKKARCPGCGGAVPVPDASAPAPPSVRYWFFQWGDWSDVKKKKAFFVVGEDTLWTAPLEGKAAKRAEEALDNGSTPEEALGDKAHSIPFADIMEVRANKRRTNLIVDHQAEPEGGSEDFAFFDHQTRDEAFAELRRRLEGWQYERQDFSRVRAAVEPVIAIGCSTFCFIILAGLALWFKTWNTDNSVIAMIRFLGPIGWALIGFVVALGLAAWLILRVHAPPIMLYLRPPNRGKSSGGRQAEDEDDEQDVG